MPTVKQPAQEEEAGGGGATDVFGQLLGNQRRGGVVQALPAVTQPAQEEEAGGGATGLFGQLLGNQQPGGVGQALPAVPLSGGNQAVGRMLASAGQAVPGLDGVGDMAGGPTQAVEEDAAADSARDSGDLSGLPQQAGGQAPERQQQQSGGGFLSRLVGSGRGLFSRLFGRFFGR